MTAQRKKRNPASRPKRDREVATDGQVIDEPEDDNYEIIEPQSVERFESMFAELSAFDSNLESVLNFKLLKKTKGPGKSASSIYMPNLHDKLVYLLCSMYSPTDREISKVLGITYKQFEEWLRVFSSFRKSYDSGRDAGNISILEKSLFMVAKGYSYTETTIENVVLKDGVGRHRVDVPAIKTKKVRKRIAPNVTGLMFYLQNRSPDRWKSIQQLLKDDDTGQNHGQIDQSDHTCIANLTDEEVKELHRITNKMQITENNS